MHRSVISAATKELTDNWADYWCKEDTKLDPFYWKG